MNAFIDTPDLQIRASTLLERYNEKSSDNCRTLRKRKKKQYLKNYLVAQAVKTLTWYRTLRF